MVEDRTYAQRQYPLKHALSTCFSVLSLQNAPMLCLSFVCVLYNLLMTEGLKENFCEHWPCMSCRDLDQDDEAAPKTPLERALAEILDRHGGVSQMRHLPKLLGLLQEANQVTVKLILLAVGLFCVLFMRLSSRQHLLKLLSRCLHS
jgi:hypothetical protein